MVFLSQVTSSRGRREQVGFASRTEGVVVVAEGMKRYFIVAVLRSPGNDTHHLQCPDPPDPNLERAVDSVDVLKVGTFPPASTRRFSPEEQQLLSHAEGGRGRRRR